jgi:hypothetical protein
MEGGDGLLLQNEPRSLAQSRNTDSAEIKEQATESRQQVVASDSRSQTKRWAGGGGGERAMRDAHLDLLIVFGLFLYPLLDLRAIGDATMHSKAQVRLTGLNKIPYQKEE